LHGYGVAGGLSLSHRILTLLDDLFRCADAAFCLRGLIQCLRL